MGRGSKNGTVEMETGDMGKHGKRKQERNSGDGNWRHGETWEEEARTEQWRWKLETWGNMGRGSKNGTVEMETGDMGKHGKRKQERNRGDGKSPSGMSAEILVGKIIDVFPFLN